MKKGSKMTLEQRRKLSESHKGNTSWLGRHHSEKSKKKMSVTHKSQHFSPKTEFKKGLIPWNKGTKGVMPIPWNKGKKMSVIRKGYTHWNKGKHSSEESRKRMSESQERLWRNPEHRKQMSQSAKVSINTGRFRKGHEFPEETKQKIREYTLKQYESGSFPKQTNTKPEKQIKEELLKRGYIEGVDFIHQYKFNNKFMCDFCFPKQRVIVEAYGDFWHANPIKYAGKELYPQQRRAGRDKARKAYISKFDNSSWTFLSFWESDIKKNVSECVNKIEEILAKKKKI